MHSPSGLILVFRIIIYSSVLSKVWNEKSDKPFGTVFYEEINSWSKCSTSCGNGVQEKLKACFRKSLYITENVPYEKCAGIKELNKTIKTCNHGECSDSYFWKVQEWSKCSHTCGNTGVEMRDVECFNNKDKVVDQEMCNERYAPISLRSCNRYNCPPNFVPQQWGPCVKTNECLPGRQRRKLMCLTLFSNGTVASLQKQACYINGQIPPSNWRKCTDHIDSRICNKKVELLPEIIVEKRILVQMRRIKRLDIKIGETAYIIPGTRLSLHCVVNNFSPANLIWNHEKIKYQYKGKSKNRLKVTRNGKMIIKSFLIQDQGKWVCKAGNVSAHLEIKPKSPSGGFKDWAIRNTMWNKEMPNDVQTNLIRWVTGAWGKCSVSCDGQGIQTRMVGCENLENRLYYQLDDSECYKIFGPKAPPNERNCLNQFPCPIWNYVNVDTDKCTDRCINYEKALFSGDLKCMFENQSIDYEKCDSKKKPIVECFNPDCKSKWKISPWTKCSRSCGPKGIQARYLMCVWEKSEQPAGDMCYKLNIKVPSVIKVCHPPKCNLQCVDLLRNCKRKESYCWIGTYSYNCCKTCKAYFKRIQNENS